MSGVNITVLEGGKAENFGQVTKLRTDNGDGHDLWVPKVDVQTKSLSVKKNGLYYTKEYTPTASEKKDGHAYDIYGWDTITVSVKKKVKGKKKKTDPSTGLDYDVPTTVTVDDDGNLIEEELPTSIKITKEPTTTIYANGQSISIAGIVVHAYLEDGTDWGEVPFEELSFEPTVADAEESHPSYSGFKMFTGYVNYGDAVASGASHFQWSENPVVINDIEFVFPRGYLQSVSITNTKTGYSVMTGGKAFWFDEDASIALYVAKTDGSYALAYAFFRPGSGATGGFTSDPLIFPDAHEHSGQEITVSWDNEDLDEPLTDKYSVTVILAPTPST